MKVKKLSASLALAASLALVMVGSVTASAAPDLGTTTATNCTITKVDQRGKSSYRVQANFSFAVNNDQNFSINAHSAVMRNNGGQNVREVSYTKFKPAKIGSGTLFDFTVDYNFASSLKDVTYHVYNGKSMKGTAYAACQRIGWSN